MNGNSVQEDPRILCQDALQVLCKSVFYVHCARITSLVMLRNAKPTDSARPSRSVEPQSRKSRIEESHESLGE